MKFRSLIVVAVLALSSTSFAEYKGVAAGPKAPCPKAVALLKQGIKGMLNYSSPAQQQFNQRVIASYSGSSSARQKSASVQNNAAQANGKSTK